MTPATRRPLIALPFHDWRKVQREGLRTRDGHLLRELSRDERLGPVLVIDRPVSRAERWRSRAPGVVDGSVVGVMSGRGWQATLTSPEPGLTVLDTAVGDIVRVAVDPRGWWFDIFGDRRLHAAVRWAMSHLAIKASSVACIAWTPTASALVEHLQPARFVFDALDNWLIHPVLRRHADRASAAYRTLQPLADLVTVSGPASAAALARIGVPSRVVPNGVDVERFSSSGPRPDDLPGRPIVGYAGKLAERIDIDLVRTVARSLPEMSFVFLGPILDRRVGGLRTEPNVLLMGDRRPEVLPDYLAAFNVAWIPHRVGQGETGGDPIKLYEYWAAGRQVVTTAIDGSDGWRQRAFVIDGADKAVEAIRAITSGAKRLPTWVEPERHWSAIARLFADELVGAHGAMSESATVRRTSPGRSSG